MGICRILYGISRRVLACRLARVLAFGVQILVRQRLSSAIAQVEHTMEQKCM